MHARNSSFKRGSTLRIIGNDYFSVAQHSALLIMIILVLETGEPVQFQKFRYLDVGLTLESWESRPILGI